VAITISADDPRSIRAIELAADAGQWLRCRTRDGQTMWGLPSNTDPDRYYLVTSATCECSDFRRNGLSRARLGVAGEHRACKHILAVRLHTELVRAVRGPESHAARRGHLRVLPSPASARA
jgi:hypothetical protein